MSQSLFPLQHKVFVWKFISASSADLLLLSHSGCSMTAPWLCFMRNTVMHIANGAPSLNKFKHSDSVPALLGESECLNFSSATQHMHDTFPVCLILFLFQTHAHAFILKYFRTFCSLFLHTDACSQAVSVIFSVAISTLLRNHGIKNLKQSTDYFLQSLSIL